MSTTRLTKSTAGELMQADVVCLSTTTPIPEAVRMFEEYRISGAPVLDTGGNLVGVLSAFDIARSNHVDDGGISSERNHYYLSDPFDEEGDDPISDRAIFSKSDYSDSVMGAATVGDWMNANVISVDVNDGLEDVCKVMAAERIHRVLVVSEGRVRGILSSFDVVRYVAGAK